MKNLFTTVLLWGVIFMANVNAQIQVADTLRIINEDIMYCKVAHPDIHSLKTNAVYKELIYSFQTQLESIKEQIPEYLNYRITYVKDYNLIIEEVTGIVKYRVEDGKIADSYSENVALLQFENLKIQLFFNNMEELLTMDYEHMIETAISDLKSRKRIFSALTKDIMDNYAYSYSEKKLAKGDGINPQNGFGLFINASVGLFKNDPIYEYSIGAGYVFGGNKQNWLYCFIGRAHQFNKEINTDVRTTLMGIAYKPSRYFSTHFAIPLNKEETYRENIPFRYGLTVYPFRGLSVTTFFYHSDKEGDGSFFPGISIGYGL